MKISIQRNQVSCQIIFLSMILLSLNGYAQKTDSTKIQTSRAVRLGFGYQVQEFQLINQNLNSSCNCDEGLRLKDRSMQTFGINLLIPFGDQFDNYRWALGFDFGFAKGRVMNDQKIYSDAKTTAFKAELIYHLFSPRDKFRPYFTAAAYSYTPLDNRITSYPVGGGFSFRLKEAAFLRVQSTYDAGQTAELSRNLITGISLQFPLYKRSKGVQVVKEPSSKPLVKDIPVPPVSKPTVETKLAASNPEPSKPSPASITTAAPVVTPSPASVVVKDPTSAIAQNISPVTTKVETPTAMPAAKPPVSVQKIVEELNKIVYFDTDKSLLNKEGTYKTLAEVIAFMKKYPNTRATLTGHTDFRASVEYNMALSKRRVIAVFDYLVKSGIKPERIVKDYYGKSKPAANNDSDTGMASNRRVEIWIK